MGTAFGFCLRFDFVKMAYVRVCLCMHVIKLLHCKHSHVTKIPVAEWWYEELYCPIATIAP